MELEREIYKRKKGYRIDVCYKDGRIAKFDPQRLMLCCNVLIFEMMDGFVYIDIQDIDRHTIVKKEKNNSRHITNDEVIYNNIDDYRVELRQGDLVSLLNPKFIKKQDDDIVFSCVDGNVHTIPKDMFTSASVIDKNYNVILTIKKDEQYQIIEEVK